MATKSGSPGRPSESRWLTALAGDKHRLQRSKAMRNGLNHTSLNQVAAVHQIAACDSAWPHSAVAGRDTDSGAERDKRELWVSKPGDLLAGSGHSVLSPMCRTITPGIKEKPVDSQGSALASRWFKSESASRRLRQERACGWFWFPLAS